MASNMTEHDVERIATKAADKAVHDVLLSLGIDARNALETQRDLATLRELRDLFNNEEFEADLMHLRRWRRTVESVGKQGLFTTVTVLFTGTLGLLWLAAETYLKR
jgi:hypothetical protein